MSIRITNNKNKRVIVVKNQDDINHLNRAVSTVNTEPTDTSMFNDRDSDLGLDFEKDDAPYQQTASFQDSPDAPDLSSWISRLKYQKNGGDLDYNSQFNLDTFDDAPEDHYIDVFAYPEEDEIASQTDDSVIQAPLLKMQDPNIPDDQTSPPAAGEEDDGDIEKFIADMSGGEQGTEGDFSLSDDTDPSEMTDATVGTGSDPTADSDLQGDEGEGSENNDYQGMIRTVRGAYLVYKRKQENGTFEEVWVFNVGKDIKQETTIRKAILAGTDVDPNTHQSDNGEQKAKTWTVGNIQFITISGLNQ